MILADLAASKVAAEGDPRVWGGERSWGMKGGTRGEEAKGRVGELVFGRYGSIKVAPCHYPLMRDAKG